MRIDRILRKVDVVVHAKEKPVERLGREDLPGEDTYGCYGTENESGVNSSDIINYFIHTSME